MTKYSPALPVGIPDLRFFGGVMAAFLFIEHGMAKFFAYPVSFGIEIKWFSLIGLAGTLELVGAPLLLLGLFTRPVAFVLSGEMAFAYFMAHAPQGFWPLANQGMAASLKFMGYD